MAHQSRDAPEFDGMLRGLVVSLLGAWSFGLGASIVMETEEVHARTNTHLGWPNTWPRYFDWRCREEEIDRAPRERGSSCEYPGQQPAGFRRERGRDRRVPETEREAYGTT